MDVVSNSSLRFSLPMVAAHVWESSMQVHNWKMTMHRIVELCLRKRAKGISMLLVGDQKVSSDIVVWESGTDNKI